ncbi:hypothetical protein [Dyadobacter sandarakinus]|uniref:PD-(D/E)XK nuclease superfamily protein n=1 Tax=Dyadobacter sandarakinus TaxID=2747268 RepID=A0ABX7I9H3_9BACT|nr:hypothetical protein [Dyadobacter sandarakinus]QRR02764.1 hypothetical protein HWI92_18510 [Dyadobacter sandarakinus]
MLSADPKYRLYPTLLNTYDRFEKGLITQEELVARINRLPSTPTEAQIKGTSFEDAAIKGIGEEDYDYRILAKVRALLPRPMVKTQVYCEYQLENILLYGYVDVIGKMMAADIKTTARYTPGSYLQSHQNFYLPALRSKGIRMLRYIITDFEDVYAEEYDHTIDLTFQEEQARRFCEFLDLARPDITDQRIFGSYL